MTSIFQPKQTKSHWTNAYNKSKTMRPHNILPVPIHAFRTASRLFLLPNLVIIPITTRCLFFAWAPSFSVKSFEVKPSCLAAANSVSRADNFFCCSLNKPSPHSINHKTGKRYIIYQTKLSIKLPAGYYFQCIIHWYCRLALKWGNQYYSI